MLNTALIPFGLHGRKRTELLLNGRTNLPRGCLLACLPACLPAWLLVCLSIDRSLVQRFLHFACNVTAINVSLSNEETNWA
ncbi:hypothetical protein T07_4298 [Trichinella nelsoni]|uniref:Uncharacterized protein n=1 Tax=Trichinella nelsoni TaxID=6336 RepID=A0A0V0RL08_9BILA|nr:hypothetical protein T07_4298 [Trichinella nelsoni]